MLDGKDIIPVKLYDDRKENYIETNYTFDRVYRSWLKKLLDFVKKVAEERDKYSEEVLKSAEYSFLGTAESVADQFFYFLMKDEMSQATGNSPLDIPALFYIEGLYEGILKIGIEVKVSSGECLAKCAAVARGKDTYF